MTTLFKAPQIGEPRSTGVKNGGVTSYDTRIIAPTSRIVGDAVESGKQVQFRWRSSSSAFHNPRETKLAVRYKLKFGPLTGAGNALAAVAGGNLPSNVRFTACPNTALFADGCQYQVNSTMVENQPNYYDAAKVKLYTKYDHAADTSGSCGLLTRRKDLHAPVKNTVTYPAGGTDDRDGVSERAELYNPKQEIIRQAFRTDATESGEIELLDNVWLSSFEHGYFVAGADHELTLTFAQNFADMFHSQSFVYKGEDAAGDPTTVTQAPYESLVVGKLPADNACTAKTIYCEITDIALHVAMAGTVPSIPPSVALKYSELMIVNRELTQQQNEISLVVPPSTRALYCFSRQQIHDVRADAEELGLAGAGIDEVGLCGAGAGDTATIPHTITNLMFELGGQLQPGNGGYNNMDVTQFKAGRAFTDALSVVGKPSAMRPTSWDFVDWCGKKSANGRTFPTDATGQVGFPARDVADETFGDQGPGYFVRMILPPNSLSNVLTVRCTLDDAPQATAKQQLTIVAVHDSLWTMQYAPPAELPIETKVSPIT
eukprot:COSAG06_NODE_2057_length_7713_cov_16.657998_6_plen_544_part_00